ncbi:MAG: UDP-N-acetylmuramoyl-L-alanyl-D-glutamate--2,6-diaminopimelate ligase [Mariprofundaceae bacterium]|nr:UDP-N-acetylmuramoyl-L-alanyl-D-glutamate--2,6-diaminopimelate ligase [Mariprofundaceae bacterium]
MNNLSLPPRHLSQLSEIKPTRDVSITGICDDSRAIQPGDAFLCLPRTTTAAAEYIRKAEEAGAKAIITVGHLHPSTLPCLHLPGMDEAGKLLRSWFETEHCNVNCVGITGTDGKTSIAWMLREALSRHPGAAWSVGTLGLVRDPSDIEDIGNTTPSLITSHRLLAVAQQQEIGSLIMEVSSHGIEQERIAGIPFGAAIWSNLGHDHLQDHGGFDAYAALKAQFVSGTAHRGGLAICNADDENIRKLMAENDTTAHFYAHGLYAGDGDRNIDLTWEQELPGMVRFAYRDREVCIEDIPAGEFHAENLAAVALTLILHFGLEFEMLPSLLQGMTAPPGRMQPLEIGRWQVFIDYAHTPEALERCLATARTLTRNRLIVVFGCGGARDREKRPEMGAIAVEQADMVWITSDNPRSEPPEIIASEIESGMRKPYPAEVFLELDRKAAIAAAISAMQPGDSVVIAGKGHESYMEIDGHRTPWSDFDIAADCLHLKEDRRMRLCA